MNILFDFEQMKKELIDVSLKTKNKELFLALCQKEYKEYISTFLGFKSFLDFKRALGQSVSDEELEISMKKQLLQDETIESWLCYAEKYLHPLIHKFAQQHPNFVRIKKKKELKTWNKLSLLLNQGLPLRNIRSYVLGSFDKEIAYPFISYLNKQPL